MIYEHSPGRLQGSIIVLQMIVAQLLATHPDGESLINKIRALPLDFEPDPGESEPERLAFLADVYSGAQETLNEVERMSHSLRRDRVCP